MTKYRPVFDWTPQERVIRVVCGMCPGVELSATVAGARAHVLAHRDHVVALVAEITTLLSVHPDEDEIAVTPVTVRPLEFDRV